MKSFLFSTLAQAALAVGRNFMAITSPRIMAIIVDVPDFVPSQIIRGRKRRPIPMPRATLWVNMKMARIMPSKISNPCQYP